ncbi:hypothetical protein [Loktanella sp. Alg231-35]|uniref:hypothetical protein n=1 Tax=Loktanella sp. Alg231-35 TaxID=1922220 RepID=UPI00131F37A0|nr:hypothetical protein [Loktanella sp. Alg231-35]
MKYMILGSVLALAACEGTGAMGGGGSGRQEYMVIGNRMSFEQCRARGGLIIRDSNTSMVACDPTIRREPEPADEFNHPSGNS